MLINYATNKNKVVIHLALTATLQNSFIGVVPSMMAVLAVGTGYQGADVE